MWTAARSEYLGTGPVAEVIAAAHEAIAAHRQAKAAWAKEEMDLFEARERLLGFDDYYGRIETFAAALMVAAGFHRHDRGRWRKRKMREVSGGMPALVEASGPLAAAGCQSEEERLRRFDEAFPSTQRIQDVFARAARGDHSAVAPLQKMIACIGDDSLARAFEVDLPGKIQRILVDWVSGQDLATRECLIAELERMRRDLAGPTPTISERVLAERATLAWLHAHCLEVVDLKQGHAMAPAVAEAFRRRIDRANRKFLESLKTLAMVRRLALPALQVNVAQNQVVAPPQAKRGRRPKTIETSPST